MEGKGERERQRRLSLIGKAPAHQVSLGPRCDPHTSLGSRTLGQGQPRADSQLGLQELQPAAFPAPPPFPPRVGFQLTLRSLGRVDQETRGDSGLQGAAAIFSLEGPWKVSGMRGAPRRGLCGDLRRVICPAYPASRDSTWRSCCVK